MKQFVVPQFIDVENKILGPITVRQFSLLLIALLISIIIYRFVDFSLFVLVTAINFGSAAFFSFVRINGRPVHYLLLSLIQTLQIPRVRVWNKNFSDTAIKQRMQAKIRKKETVVVRRQQVRRSKLSELALVVDTGGKYVPQNNTLEK